MSVEPWRLSARWREPLGDAGGYVYLRNSARIGPHGRTLRCIDVADVHLPEHERGRGTFSAYLQALEFAVAAEPTLDAICVCDVLNKRLGEWLARRPGYVAIVHGDANFVWLKGRPQ